MIIEFLQPIIALFLENPVTQTLGLIGMLLVVAAYIHQDDTKTIKTLFVANFFWAVLFFSMNELAWLAATFLSSLRLVLSLHFKKNLKVFGLLVALIIGFWIFSYQTPTSLLPLTTSLIWAYGFMFLTGLHLRISCLVASTLWLSYYLSLWVIGWVINEVMVEVLLIISIFRFSGFHAHRFHVVDTIKHLIHFPHREIDYGDYVIMKDKTKVSTTHKIREKIRNFFHNLKISLSNKLQKSQENISESLATVQQKTSEVKTKLPKIKKQA